MIQAEHLAGCLELGKSAINCSCITNEKEEEVKRVRGPHSSGLALLPLFPGDQLPRHISALAVPTWCPLPSCFPELKPVPPQTHCAFSQEPPWKVTSSLKALEIHSPIHHKQGLLAASMQPAPSTHPSSSTPRSQGEGHVVCLPTLGQACSDQA